MNTVIIFLDNRIKNYEKCFDFFRFCLDTRSRLKRVGLDYIVTDTQLSIDDFWRDYNINMTRNVINGVNKRIYFEKVLLIVNISGNLLDLKHFVLLWQVLSEKYPRLNFSSILHSKDKNDYFKVSHLLKNVLMDKDKNNSFASNVKWGKGDGKLKSLAITTERNIKYTPFELITYAFFKDIWNIQLNQFLGNIISVEKKRIRSKITIEDILLSTLLKKTRDKKNIKEYIKEKNIDTDKIESLSENKKKEYSYLCSVVNYLTKNNENNFLYLLKIIQTDFFLQCPFMSIYLLSILFYNDSNLEDLEEHDKKQDFTMISALKQDLLYARDLADGIVQLLENVIIHATRGIGLFAIEAVCSGNSSKVNSFRFWIGDYSEKNMIENFKLNIMGLKRKKQFKLYRSDLDYIKESLDNKDISFFFNQDKDETWDMYNQLPGIIAHHYGLQLFQSLVICNKGVFQVQSHKLIYRSDGRKARKQPIIRGTQYNIEIPIDHKLSMTTTGIDSNVNYTNVMDLNYYIKKCYDLDKRFMNSAYSSIKENLFYAGSNIAEQKEGVINYIKDSLGKIIDSTIDDALDYSGIIYWLDASKIMINRVELLCKAIVLFMSQTKQINYNFSFINCSEYFIVEMVRMFSVFYGKNGEFKYIKNVQIYFSGGRNNAGLEFILAGNSLKRVVSNAQKYAFFSGFRPSSLTYLELMLEKRLKLIPDGCTFSESREIVPFDLLFNDDILNNKCESIELQNDNSKTLFEYKVEEILKNDIQNNEWGCHLKNVHIRLGKEIHTDSFYEAELLFHNNLYTYRFARLLVRDIRKILEKNNNKNYVLVGYETYSEMLLYEIYSMIEEKYKRDDKLSYIVYEQKQIIQTYKNGINKKEINEAFRYIKYKEEGIVDQDYYLNSRFLIIVPIGSTLMTFKKIRELLSIRLGINKDFYSVNYTLILVSAEPEDYETQENYWEFKGEQRSIETKFSDGLKVRYLTNVSSKWQRACCCDKCFPTQNNQPLNKSEIYLKERPIVDTNRASIVPMVKFGRKGPFLNNRSDNKLEYGDENEKRIELLKDSLIYGHVERNDNHFMYYIKTEDLFHKHRIEVKDWLSSLSIVKSQGDEISYDFIISPMHYSNTGFIEEVNNQAFKNNSYVVYLEINKEFRSNIKAKFSNLTMLYYNLKIGQKRAILRFHYVDDMIVTGRTFYRMKSLIHSLFPEEAYSEDASVHVELYHSIIVLLNRNSFHSVNNYLNKGCEFFSFINLNISVMRSFEDACILCKYIEDCQNFCGLSSTTEMHSHWNYQMIKHQLRPMYLGYKDKNNSERVFYRMRCVHKANLEFDKMGLSINDENKVLDKIIEIIKGSSCFDELISYFKVLSRPFFTYHIIVKETIFKFNIYCAQYIFLGDNSLPQNERSTYINLFRIMRNVSDYDEDILIENIISSLSGLESNYIMRKAIFKAIVDKYKNNKGLLLKFRTFIKRIICKNADEAKSLWLENLLVKGVENDTSGIDNDFVEKYGVGSTFGQLLMVENTIIIHNAMQRLIIKLEKSISSSIEEDNVDALKEEIDNCILNEYMDFSYIQKFMRLSSFITIKDMGELLLLKYLLKNYARFGDREKFYYNLVKRAGTIMDAKNTFLFIPSKNQLYPSETEFNIISCYKKDRDSKGNIGLDEISSFADMHDNVQTLFDEIKDNTYMSYNGYILVKFDNTLIGSDKRKLGINTEKEKEIYCEHNYKPIYMVFEYDERDGNAGSVKLLLKDKNLYALRNLLTLRSDIVRVIEKDFDNDNIQSLCEKQEKMSMLFNFKSVSHTDLRKYEKLYDFIKSASASALYKDIKIIEFYFNSLIAVVYNKYLEKGIEGICETNDKCYYRNIGSYFRRIRGVIDFYKNNKNIEFIDGNSLAKSGDSQEGIIFSKEIDEKNIRITESSNITYNKMYFVAFFIDMLKSVTEYGSPNEKGKYVIYVWTKDNKIMFKNETSKNEPIDKANRDLRKSLKGKGSNGISLFVAKKFFEQEKGNDEAYKFDAYYSIDSCDEKIYYTVEWPIIEGGNYEDHIDN